MQTVSAVAEQTMKRHIAAMGPAAAAAHQVEFELQKDHLRRAGLPHGRLLLSGVRGEQRPAQAPEQGALHVWRQRQHARLQKAQGRLRSLLREEHRQGNE